MEVIGKTGNGSYVAVVTHSELQKCFSKYYGNDKLAELKVGDSIDIGAGFNFHYQIEKVCKDMQESMKSFEQAKNTLLKFSLMVSEQVAKEEIIDEL